MADLTEELTRLLPSGRVLVAEEDIAPYCTDWRGRVTGRPRCVALPGTTEEVATVVRATIAAGEAVYPQGGNTGLCYGSVPEADSTGIMLALNRMDRIRKVDRVNNALFCDAGVVLTRVHEAAAEAQRHFPLHLGSEGSAQIGGLISTNAGGTGVLRYGPMRDLVLGLEVVLADGRIWNGLTSLRKDNTAYDLKQLFIGAEGTLGVVTGAALKLFPALKARADAWVAVERPAQALELLGLCQEAFDTRIQAFELLSRSEVEITLKNVPGNRIPFAAAPPWSVLIELGDTDPDAPLTQRLEVLLASAMERGLAQNAVVARSGAQADAFWRLRHSVSEANKHHGLSHTHDVAVPVSAVPAFLAEADAMLAARYPKAEPVVVCHLGDGNIHYIAMYSFEDWAAEPEPARTIAELEQAVHNIAVQLGGTFSAEHGIGRKLVAELNRLTDPIERAILRSVKASLDPKGRLNPGVLFAE